MLGSISPHPPPKKKSTSPIPPCHHLSVYTYSPTSALTSRRVQSFLLTQVILLVILLLHLHFCPLSTAESPSHRTLATRWAYLFPYKIFFLLHAYLLFSSALRYAANLLAHVLNFPSAEVGYVIRVHHLAVIPLGVYLRQQERFRGFPVCRYVG